MHLPAAVIAYFDADRTDDADALIQAFAANATVKDEGSSHSGHPAIRSWWLAAKEKYRHVAEPVEMAEQAGRYVVRSKVSGAFPGSPAMIDFDFKLDAGKIVDLKIG